MPIFVLRWQKLSEDGIRRLRHCIVTPMLSVRHVKTLDHLVFAQHVYFLVFENIGRGDYRNARFTYFRFSAAKAFLRRQEDYENFSNNMWSFRTRMPSLRRQDLL